MELNEYVEALSGEERILKNVAKIKNKNMRKIQLAGLHHRGYQGEQLFQTVSLNMQNVEL